MSVFEGDDGDAFALFSFVLLIPDNDDPNLVVVVHSLVVVVVGGGGSVVGATKKQLTPVEMVLQNKRTHATNSSGGRMLAII
mmetsp:Transcript_25364/g.39040  ORF Transcript_25364/g.39040 Transcript_25364/m.39040 type:complete len:82 (-) Transcript_25364:81-326(-)